MDGLGALDLRNSTTGRSVKKAGPPEAPPGAAWLGAAVKGAALLSPAWGAELAGRLFLTTHRRQTPPREAAWLAAAERTTIDAGPFQLAAWSWPGPEKAGTEPVEAGKPVLLVHGWDGRGSQLGAIALALAAAGQRPLAIDLPAHGETPGRQSNLLEFAAAIRGVVERLGGVAGIVAHSFGAAATTVALREPLAVDRLVYLAPSEDFSHFTSTFGSWLRLPPRLVARMQAGLERRFGTPWQELRAHHLAPSLHQPLLVLHDEDDVDVPLSHGLTYAERWPGATLVTTRGLGHRRILREPAVVTRTVDFLRST